MNLIYKLLPFLRAYRKHPMVQKYKRPAIGCIGCASILVVALGILVIFVIVQIIGSINWGTIGGIVENPVGEITNTLPVVADTGIIEQIRLFLIAIVDRLYTLVRSILA